jgi:hypothetical protein
LILASAIAGAGAGANAVHAEVAGKAIDAIPATKVVASNLRLVPVRAPSGTSLLALISK